MKAIKSILMALVILFMVTIVQAETPVPKEIVEVDFLKSLNLKYNAQGPHVLKADPVNKRIIVACVNSSVLAVIDDRTSAVQTIPIGTRMPRRFHYHSLAIDPGRHRVYLAGEKQVVEVNLQTERSQQIALPADFEVVAIDPTTGRAFLSGRNSGELIVVTPEDAKIKRIPFGLALPQLPWKAATPAPPIRKVLVNPDKREVYLVDGANSELITFHADKLKLLKRRKLAVPAYERWHQAGFDAKNGRIYYVLEDSNRVCAQALRIDTQQAQDIVVTPSGRYREPQGVSCAVNREEIYIPYDNHPFVQVIKFTQPVQVDSIEVPRFGMDASAVDEFRSRLWVANWSQGTLYSIDLLSRKLIYTIPQFPVYPHTNHLAFMPSSGNLYVPSGATVVNGTFGASVTQFKTLRNEFVEIPTGWGPVSLVLRPESNAFYVFSSDRQFASVEPNGQQTPFLLPYPYAHEAELSPDRKTVSVAYGPHSSFWPTFYIGSTRNGLIQMGSEPGKFKDILLDRLAQGIEFDRSGNLWAMQNTWGEEAPFLSYSPASGEAWQRVVLDDRVENECVFRLLKSDPELNLLYVILVGERNDEPGRLHIIDNRKLTEFLALPVGINPTDLCVQPKTNEIIITSFDSDSVTFVERGFFQMKRMYSGKQPIACAADALRGITYILNHGSKSLTIFDKETSHVPLPAEYLPNNLLVDESTGTVFITAHQANQMKLLVYHPDSKQVTTLLEKAYPYGEVTFDQSNSAFAERAQWGDAIFKITQMQFDTQRRLWVTDYLSGKLWIVKF
jgi:DNA-binding beta-propeller fold protein YncE